jgi:polysaccharide export outer membrane protein
MKKTALTWIVGMAVAIMLQALWARPGLADDYRIAPSDVLEIAVYGEEGLKNQELIVRPDGKVSFPMVGDIEVGGLTTAEVKERAEQKIREFIPEAMITVGVRKLGSMQYYVMGKVNKPGMYNVATPLNVLQALSLAGGLTIFANEGKISIVRKVGEKTIKLPFNYKDIKKGKKLEQNIVLERGDVVLVP